VLEGFETRLIDESFLWRPLSLSELLRVEVAALWQRVPATKTFQRAKSEVRLKFLISVGPKRLRLLD
jgi:hypothetical protein